MQSSRYLSRAAVWQPASRMSLITVQERYRSWLLDASSLTQRVIGACAGEFRVQVLSQRWTPPYPDERRCLGMRRGALALVRQVRLTCNGRPWVYARTVIPRTTLTGAQRRLARLGSRPLGAALFADPTTERGPVEIAALVPGDALFDVVLGDAAPAPERIWGRRSVFRISGKPLLVSEFFLPEIPATPCRP